MPPTLPPDTRSAHFPFESRFVEVMQHTIHYIDEGTGPTLLLLHGNPTWSFLYRHLVPRLRDQFRCIALDYPGFGLSTADEGYDFLPASHGAVVEAFLRTLGIDTYTPVVQDWGGPIGLWVAGRHPKRVRGLVVGNTWAWPIEGDVHFERFSDLMGGSVGAFAIRHMNAFVNVMIPMGCRRRKLSPPEMDAYRLPFPTWEERRRTWIFPREIRGSGAFLAQVEAGLAHLRDKPALLTWGDRDIAFKDKERVRFERMLPRHRTVALPGSGHYIQEDAPDEMVQAIRRWWREDVEV